MADTLEELQREQLAAARAMLAALRQGHTELTLAYHNPTYNVDHADRALATMSAAIAAAESAGIVAED